MLRSGQNGISITFRIAAMLTVTGALAGFVTADFLPRRYVSRTAVAFTEKVSSERCIYAAAQTLSPAALKPIVVQSAYYRPQLDYTPEEELVERIRQSASIRCTRVEDGRGEKDGFRVQFADADRYLTLEMARILVEETGKNAQARMKVTEPIRAGTTGPGAASCVLTGMAGGAALGMLAGRLASRS
jgi:hypothetical protein